MSQPKVTIVIVNWNGFLDTIECLESLSRLQYSNYDIIIIDNGSSTGDSRLLKQKYSMIKVVELKRNIGFANANNVGILLALQNRSDYVLLLNNDTTVESTFLNKLVKVAEKEPAVGIFGPKMYFYDDKKKLWYAGGKINMYLYHTQHLGKIDDNGKKPLIKTDYVAGACMLIRSEVFRKVGLLPREYFLGWEDIDFCVAAGKMGFGCMYIPSAQIWHKASASYRRHNLAYKQVFYGFRNRVLMRKKFLSSTAFTVFILIQLSIVVPLHIIYYLSVYKDPKRVRSMIEGFIAGARNKGKKKILYSLE